MALLTAVVSSIGILGYWILAVNEYSTDWVELTDSTRTESMYCLYTVQN